VAHVEIIGRRSSHFTRVALVFAEELGVPYELVPVYDLKSLDPACYGGNPALKVPALRRGGALVFGAENVCRALADMTPGARVVWPEEMRDDLSRNAMELVRHAMTAQVQLAFGTIIAGLPAENVYFTKGRAGFEGALRWLDEHLGGALAALPSPRAVSFVEAMLFCLVEHLAFRGTLPLEPYPELAAFARAFGARPSAGRTSYRFDAPPA
jgi:glutathione S-transferase